MIEEREGVGGKEMCGYKLARVPLKFIITRGRKMLDWEGDFIHRSWRLAREIGGTRRQTAMVEGFLPSYQMRMDIGIGSALSIARRASFAR